MKAVVFTGKQHVVVREVEEPRLIHPTDAILRVTSSAICGSDLHMYDGRTNAASGTVFGHEIMGVVDQVGPAVHSVSPGDRVVLPFNVACGYCLNCSRGMTQACLTMNAASPGAAYGYAGMGPYRGGQAEFVRVPFVDFNALKLPGSPGDKWEDDFLMLADIFPTGYHGCELARVEPGTSVAIYGAGPVGLLAAHSALIRGAAQVFVVDRSEERLALAERMGAVAIAWKEGAPAEQIRRYRRSNTALVESYRDGEAKLLGVSCGIDAVGYQAHSFDAPDREDPTAVLRSVTEVVNEGGTLGIVGVYSDEDPGAAEERARVGEYLLPFGKMWRKGLVVATGQCPVKRYNAYLRDLIIAGKARPSQVISHRVGIEDAPEAYRMFDQRGVGEGEEYTKVVLKLAA